MSKIRECFISRWGQQGYVLEADYSQLEVIALAFLSGDKQMKEDIENGLDMHCLNASFLYNEKYEIIKAAVDMGDKDWKAKRKTSKSPGFLIQYGGGAEAMALQTGLDKKQCAEFIKNYYARYKGVKKWQQSVADAVELSKKPSRKRTEKGHQAHKGVYHSVTGRDYVFYESDALDFLVERGIYTSFPPTLMKNYPVQGFATADIVPMIVGDLYFIFVNDPLLIGRSLLANTIHDSIMVDTHEDVLDYTAYVLKQTMESAPKRLKELFDIDFDFALPVEIKYGRNLLDQKTYVFT